MRGENSLFHRKKSARTFGDYGNAAGFVFFDQANTRVDGGQVVVKHPAVPDGLVVVRLLILAVMANAEVIGQLEQVAFVFFIEYVPYLRP